MSDIPKCPKCNSEHAYLERDMFVCPMCSHEWSSQGEDTASVEAEESVVKDSNGNVLQDGDDVVVIKELKIKGTSSVVKIGTKVKGIRLVDGDHDIDCKIKGIGPMQLKSEFVKKAK